MSDSPFGCIAQGCPRRSRSKRKPGLCNTCYNRRYTGAPPLFPAQPLIDYMAERGVTWKGGTIPKNKVTLERLDAICIDVLGVHPYVVYGDLYFQECVA